MQKNEYHDILKILLEARIRKGEHQSQTAFTLGITQSYYSKLESGQALINLEMLIKLTNHFGLKLELVSQESISGENQSG